MQVRHGALREYLNGALWVLPTISVVIVLALGALLSTVELDQGSLFGWLSYRGNADAARQILTVVSATMITVIALVFSLTIVALQNLLDAVQPPTAPELPARPADPGRAQRVRQHLRLQHGRAVHHRCRAQRSRVRARRRGGRCPAARVREPGDAGVLHSSRRPFDPDRYDHGEGAAADAGRRGLHASGPVGRAGVRRRRHAAGGHATGRAGGRAPARVCAKRRHPRSDGPRRALRVLDQGSVPGRAAREPGDPGRRRLATHTRRAAALARARGRAAWGHPDRVRAHARARRPVRHPPARRHRLQGALAGHQRPVHRGAGHRPALGRPGRSRPPRDRRPTGVRRRRRAARCGHVAGVRHLPGPRLRPNPALRVHRADRGGVARPPADRHRQRDGQRAAPTPGGAAGTDPLRGPGPGAPAAGGPRHGPHGRCRGGRVLRAGLRDARPGRPARVRGLGLLVLGVCGTLRPTAAVVAVAGWPGRGYPVDGKRSARR